MNKVKLIKGGDKLNDISFKSNFNEIPIILYFRLLKEKGIYDFVNAHVLFQRGIKAKFI